MNLSCLSRPAKRVAIVTATVGSGHNQVARAIVEALAATCPSVAVTVLDAMALAPRWFRAYYAGGFALAMTRFPILFGLGFWLNDHPQRPGRGLMERARLATEGLVTRQLMEKLRRLQPDLIVNTHFLGPPQTARLIARGELACRQWVVITDYRVHRFWHSECVDRWFVPARFSAGPLGRWGVEPERITVSGIPIHSKWRQAVDRQKVLADWHLPADKKIVIVSGGTEFTCGPVVKIARGICRACPDTTVVVLAGRDKKLLGRLATGDEAGKQLFGISFTDRAAELVGASSLMVTKAGGVTVTECLARSVPMVLTSLVPGHEAGNARYLADQGAAVICRGVKQVVSQVRQLMDQPQDLAELAQAAGRLWLDGAKTIAIEIRRALEQ